MRIETEASDAELARRIGSGDDGDAEAELVRRMTPRARLYGLRRLRDAGAAEDLAQQVLLTTLEALRAGRLRKPEKLASFVLGTCRLTVLNFRRSASARKRLLARFGDSLTPAPVAAPRLDHEKLVRCVQGLRERERAVIMMTFYDERTGADVAGLLGISETNVRVIRHRAIQTLRRRLGGGGLKVEDQGRPSS